MKSLKPKFPKLPEQNSSPELVSEWLALATVAVTLLIIATMR